MSSRLAENDDVASGIRLLEGGIESQMEYRGLPGLSLGIVYDQELVWARGFGLADVEQGRAAAPETLYRIASISKLFTATAIMQLRDAGKLRLDDPVNDRLPWFSIKQTYDGGPAITLRQLITHTSGLPRELSGVNWSDLTFPAREELRRVLPGQEMVSAPEMEWRYSNLAVSLAGEVVSQVSGEPWPQYVERHVLQPLGMAATRTVPARDTPGLAIGYGRRVPGRARAVEPFVDIGAEAPAG